MSEQKLFDAAMVLLKKEAENAACGRPRGPVPAALAFRSWHGSKSGNFWASGARFRPAPAGILSGRMEDEARANFELDFTAIAHVTLDDADGGVRMHAIRTLWECEDPKLIDRFLRLMEKDPEAARALLRRLGAGRVCGTARNWKKSRRPSARRSWNG